MTSNRVQPRTCLVTGGAGFIGSATIERLAAGASFDRVVVVDSLHPQVHGIDVDPALVVRRGVELVVGDVADADTWDRTLDLLAGRCPEVVLHLAAETGTGQSLLESSRHVRANLLGTSRLMDALASTGTVPEHVVLASSRAVYGEGSWRAENGDVYPGQRSTQALERSEWNFRGAAPQAMHAESTVPHPVSVYGVTKLGQEQLLQTWCTSMGSSIVALRLQNVYGPGQSLNNSYTGIMQIFCRLAREGRSIPLFEDGEVRRDFVHIDDVARALSLAVTSPGRTFTVDIGSGGFQTLREAARMIAAHYGAPEPHVTGQYRQGDVRHAWADVAAAKEQLGWAPEVSFADGVRALAAWVDLELG